MKTLATIIFIWLLLNATALLINLLFSNPITAAITFLAFFTTGIWIIRKAIKL